MEDENWQGYKNILLPLGHKGDVNNLTLLSPLLLAPGESRIDLMHVMVEGKYSQLPREWREGSKRVTESHHEMMRRGVDSESHMMTASSLEEGMLKQAGEIGSDLILLGWGPKPKSSISKLVTNIMSNADCDVIVFKARGNPEEVEKIVYPVAVAPNERRLRLLKRFMENTGAKLSFAHVTGFSSEDKDKGEEFLEDISKTADEIGIEADAELFQSENPPDKIAEISSNYDLMILGPSRGWWLSKALFGHKTDEIASRADCSVLMHKQHE